MSPRRQLPDSARRWVLRTCGNSSSVWLRTSRSVRTSWPTQSHRLTVTRNSSVSVVDGLSNDIAGVSHSIDIERLSAALGIVSDARRILSFRSMWTQPAARLISLISSSGWAPRLPAIVSPRSSEWWQWRLNPGAPQSSFAPSDSHFGARIVRISRSERLANNSDLSASAGWAGLLRGSHRDFHGPFAGILPDRHVATVSLSWSTSSVPASV